MKRRGKRGTKQKQPVNRTPWLRPDLHFNFFGLSAELRNLVYGELWHLDNRVAVYHEPTRSGILAYYDGMKLNESGLTDARDFSWSEESADWRPNYQSGLPQWLLTNKATLAEGIAQFRLHAHWNIWPVGYTGSHSIAPDTAIMSPKHAVSLSFSRMVFPNVRRVPLWRFPGAIRPDPPNRLDGIALFARDSTWLDLLASNLDDTAKVQRLNIALGFPYTHFLRNMQLDKNGDSTELEMNIQFPYQDLIAACKALRTLDVVLFNFMDDRQREVLDAELLEGFRPQFKKAMGDTVQEEMTMTQSELHPGQLHGKVLFDRRLVYKATKAKVAGETEDGDAG
jgi:hypothetical protein